NMAYVHKKCAMDTFSISDAKELTHLDILSRLERYVESTPEEDSPYLELREYFRLSDKTPISLSFHDIERIQGDKLDWEAYFYNAFWYDDTPDKSSMLWQEEDFPFHMFRFTTIGYNISESWLSQGYRIKALYVNERRIVFRRVLQEVSGLRLPKTLFRKKYPRKAAYEWEQFCSYFVKKWG
ncbi:hypothetical protein, partial [uncultured Bacteroides sp.]|uniref:hypothetical protein n=1 Tax=uncultured Bacteroides sp. TaxID=162156 RepID=UPI00259BE57C